MIIITFRSHTARLFLGSVLLALTWACKPAPAPSAQEAPRPTAEPAGSTPKNPRRVPSTSDLASFVRGLFPPGSVRVLDIKNDPPVPLPDAPLGTEAFVLNVRLTIAPPEDLFAPAPEQDTQTLKSLLDELHGLANWSQAYARSPYTDLGPTFTVKAPEPASPQLLVLVHAGGQPLAPLYGKVAAEWQVDHWQFGVLNLPPPTNDESRPRGWFQGATMIRGSREASHYQEEAQAAVKEAKEHQAAIEHRYQEVLTQATRSGTLYRGELRLVSSGFKKPPVPAEVRFVDTPADAAHIHQARFALKLPQSPNYDFLFQLKLADALPLGLPTSPGGSVDTPEMADATLNGSRASGKDDMGASLAGLLVQGAHGGMTPHNAPFVVRGHRLEGELAGVLVGRLVISAKQEP